MKWLAFIFILMSVAAHAVVSGIDDVNANISEELQSEIDDAITTYYMHPEVKKVDTVLSIMNESDLLRKKTAWSPLVGFLSVVFEHDRKHIFHWMALEEYNTFAQDVFVNALLTARLNETALLFAKAHQWAPSSLDNLRKARKAVDLRHLDVTLPGHIDALWGAFFASGDSVYVEQIINVLFDERPEPLSSPDQPRPEDAPTENKRLADATLRYYALMHSPVAKAIYGRLDSEVNTEKHARLKQLLEPSP